MKTKFTDIKTAKQVIDKAQKDQTGYALFSCGITILEGDKEHCITSIAYSLASLEKEAKPLYDEIMKTLEQVREELKDKEIKGNVQEEK